MDFELTEEHLAVRDAARDFTQSILLPGVIERDEKNGVSERSNCSAGRTGVYGNDG